MIVDKGVTIKVRRIEQHKSTMNFTHGETSALLLQVGILTAIQKRHHAFKLPEALAIRQVDVIVLHTAY